MTAVNLLGGKEVLVFLIAEGGQINRFDGALTLPFGCRPGHGEHDADHTDCGGRCDDYDADAVHDGVQRVNCAFHALP